MTMFPRKHECRELFFAGFLPRVVYLSCDYTSIRNLFSSRGEVHHFIYDEERGFGSVTLATAEIAFNCYLEMHLGLHVLPDFKREGSSTKDNRFTLVYLEFASCCPFVNPRLLLEGKTSRHLYCSSDVSKRRHTSYRSVAEHVVVRWREEEVAELGKQIVREGPYFPGAGTNDISRTLQEALWVTLKPDKRPSAGATVTVLDLWWEYYQRYVLHKTEPALSRIKNPYLNYAHKATVAQEIYRAMKRCEGDVHNDEQYLMTSIERFFGDEVYRCVCSHLCTRLRFCNDPSWASLVRDVVSAGGVVPEDLLKADGAGPVTNQLMEEDERENSEAELTLLQLPLLRAATNLIENVKFLRRVRRGEVEGAKKSVKPYGEGDTCDLRLNGVSITEAEDRNLLMEVVRTVDGFSPSGSAASLLLMCEDPHAFRYEKGHIGWCELHGKTESATYCVTCQAIGVALLLVGFTVWGMTHVTKFFGIEVDDLFSHPTRGRWDTHTNFQMDAL